MHPVRDFEQTTNGRPFELTQAERQHIIDFYIQANSNGDLLAAEGSFLGSSSKNPAALATFARNFPNETLGREAAKRLAEHPTTQPATTLPIPALPDPISIDADEHGIHLTSGDTTLTGKDLRIGTPTGPIFAPKITASNADGSAEKSWFAWKNGQVTGPEIKIDLATHGASRKVRVTIGQETLEADHIEIKSFGNSIDKLNMTDVHGHMGDSKIDAASIEWKIQDPSAPSTQPTSQSATAPATRSLVPRP